MDTSLKADVEGNLLGRFYPRRQIVSMEIAARAGVFTSYGNLQVKLAASSVLPVPLYLATCG
jgi:hypothetical protein